MIRACRLVAAAFTCSLFAACAARPLALPTGAGAPFPDYANTFQQLTATCGAVQTLTAELSLSGRAGRARLRGRVLAGIAGPSSIRLEAVAPFGAPFFILTARGPESILLLPRDQRVLSGVPVSDVLDALVGLALTPEQMRALVTGCVTPDPQPAGGRTYGNDWIAIDLAGNATAFIRSTPEGRRIAAATIGNLTVEYPEVANGLPRRVRVRVPRSPEREFATDLQMEIAQLETNTPLGPEVFTVDVPDSAQPISLEELRDSGPLGQAR